MIAIAFLILKFIGACILLYIGGMLAVGVMCTVFAFLGFITKEIQ